MTATDSPAQLPDAAASARVATAPTLSVVVTVVDGGAALGRCLRALVSQQSPPAMEVLVPYEGPDPPPSISRADFPTVTFLHLPATHDAAGSNAAQHERFDRRRAAGLAHARGDIVAIVEDRGVPRPDWAAGIVRVHRSRPNLAIGGAVENGCDRLLNWGVFYCDFGRYEPPFAEGPRRYLTDVNVSYKRRALEMTREVWQTRYHEPLVHWTLERAGETLLLSPDFTVVQVRDGLGWRRVLAERVAWGRLFGSLRSRDVSPMRRALLVAASPVIPFVLFARFLSDQSAQGTPPGRLVAVAPIVALLQAAWVAGEAAGYVTGRA